MFYLTYMVAELRRRKGRTLLTALGLGVGIGLVVAVSALSAGLDDAQDKVLEPLTGVGTDMSVTRPLKVSSDQLSDSERSQLEEENGGARLGLRDLGDPGEKFTRTSFVAASQLSSRRWAGRSARWCARSPASSHMQGALGGIAGALLGIAGLTRSEIFERVWGYDFGPSSNALGVYVRCLRAQAR